MAPVSLHTDEELIILLKEDDQSAYTELYNRYWSKLYRVAYNQLKIAEEAEEIVQDIFIDIWKRRKTIQLTSALNNYFAVAVKYKVIKTLAKRNHQHQYSKEALYIHSNNDNSTQEWLEFDDLKEQLSKLVDQLPDKCQKVYKLSREEENSYKQIAEKMNISEKTIESHINKALKYLRTNINYYFILF
ncbi:RNA polymerase [Pedobacter lusitanus]|uniref:RNA polymerase n=1 Tax=Pedobacter lusitanus TaxID=1503925 RepID=A0A0D0F2L5_9SPHI|nr:RNA polymerase sigma-70 factor [Pedobacter lusitanus]KIO75793.1 RNA polymerase [Pedobacter lusitanus]